MHKIDEQFCARPGASIVGGLLHIADEVHMERCEAHCAADSVLGQHELAAAGVDDLRAHARLSILSAELYKAPWLGIVPMDCNTFGESECHAT